LASEYHLCSLQAFTWRASQALSCFDFAELKLGIDLDFVLVEQFVAIAIVVAGLSD